MNHRKNNARNPGTITASIFFIGIIWYIGFSPITDIYSFVEHLYDKKRIAQLCLITLTLSIIIFSGYARQSIADLQINSTLIQIILILLIVIGLASCFISPITIYALTEFLTYLGLFSVSILSAALSRIRFNYALLSVLIGTWFFIIVYEIYFLASYFAALTIDKQITFKLLFPYFQNIRFFNQYQLILLPIASLPLVIFDFKNKTLYVTIFLAISMWFTILIATQSRGVIFSLLISLGVILLINKNIAYIFLKIFVSTFLTGLTLYIILFSAIPLSLFGEYDLSTMDRGLYSAHGRLSLWASAVTMIIDNPILGVGPMHYAYYPGPHAHPHNSILQIASEYGLPFLLLTMVALVIFLKYWLAEFNNTKNTARFTFDMRGLPSHHYAKNKIVWLSFLFSFITGCTYSLFSGIAVMPLPQTIFSIILGLMLGLLASAYQVEDKTTASNTIWIQLISGLLLISLVYIIIPHMTTRVLNPFAHTFFPTHTYGPRYWKNGGLIQEPSKLTDSYYLHPALTSGKSD